MIPEEATAVVQNILGADVPTVDMSQAGIESGAYDDGGPNSRGTYSREYTLRHPETEWVHRGQGRYLPVSAIKREVASVLMRQQRHSLRSQATDESSRRSPDIKSEAPSSEVTVPNTKLAASGTGPPPRKRRAIVETLTDSLTETPTYGLRHRASELRTSNSSESRAARLARRAKAIMSIESLDRTNSFTSNGAADSDEDEEDDEDEMSDDDVRARSNTYTRDYVDAHPNEQFYHTGNGWYKRGRRKIGTGKHTKQRESTDRAVTRESDGTIAFDTDESIHGSQLKNFPGVEFHHCGNGWYKAGPSRTGKKSSITVPMNYYEDEDDINDEQGADTVSKSYTEAHPETEWVHRGNGRYKRKDDVFEEASATPATSAGRRASEVTYSKEYVDAHPSEKFYHTGNARYKRGTKPIAKISAPDSDEEDDGPDTLYNKAYVDAHPEVEFHHRGQGRYKRGLRPSLRAFDEDEDEEDETLFDTDYVNSHPNETFYHKGQGRWARGFPPPGSSNKVAVRGPGAKERASRMAEEEGDGAEKPPGLTALVLRAEGPEKFPHLQWHYRGGGKWGRLTKQEWDKMNSANNYAIETVSKYRGTKFRNQYDEGPEAQLEREAAAAGRGPEDSEGLFVHEDGDAGVLIDDTAKPKRRGRVKRGSLQLREQVTASKHSSNEQSKAPTPKMPMLTEDQDRLTLDDLPQLYAKEWSDIRSDEAADEVVQLLRTESRPLTNPQKFVQALTQHAPEVRSLNSLVLLAANAQWALEQIQNEYLALEKITAPHARIPRKPAKGGRPPVDPAIFEDRKEADLYDYVFDQRKVGFQDPQAQRIVRDAEGRELRKRRNRSGAEINGTVPGWDFGEGADLAPKRASRQPNRFTDRLAEPLRKKMRGVNGSTKASSMTPDRAATPQNLSNGYQVPTSGRWAGHIPKRIRELRDESVVTVRSEGGTERRVRKGRPPGSKNLHKRKDAGIKKGPRKPKMAAAESVESGENEDGEFNAGNA